jgi:hypothetical protein
MFNALGMDGFSAHKTLLRMDRDEDEIRVIAVVKALMQGSYVHVNNYMAVAGTLEAAMSTESWVKFINLDEDATEHARILFRFTAPFVRRTASTVRLLPHTTDTVLKHPEIIDDLIRYAEDRNIRDPYEIDAGRYMAGLETASPSLRDGVL